ncbi:stearoyl-CoA 9-desaturase [Leptospira inadai serovar Lyme str. 10]|uniref:Stearoyl-CoA 9-desaturase n=2 Tax=Leptospira inadai serovar Lyme TaxID=293084 RepID=V6HDY8_9LEPT|nr:fatty acid desaturase [Leptospira inadai]EQA37403.1 stearoyl-CoA 9-desaturase [Leptospira inadai serovar Lyme str. 10]PNV71632.1 fatty acid desaturase [Leptospira inadai serovar Lyme]
MTAITQRIVPTKPGLKLSDKERSKRIMKWIRFRDRQLRRRFPFLKNQDRLGMGITVGSAVGMLLFAGLYITGFIPAWTCILANGILASLLHEIEHDLIHNLYYKDNLKKQNFMFWVVWIFRGNTVSPWYRRMIHTLHHKVSGHKEDIEERLIGNGMNFGLKRLLTMIDGNLSFLFQAHRLRKEAPKFKRREITRSSWPYLVIFYHLWYNFLFLNAFYIINDYLGKPISEPAWLDGIRTFLNISAVVYLIPNWIRQTSIQIVSSNMHYYGDVKGLYDQTQVLNSWLLLPLHLFCFNFGSTHGIHHFVVNQPFYLRQAVAPFVHPAMRRYGIRFNDFGSIFRANRLGKETPSTITQIA